MKVVILGKGEMLSNLIEGTLNANCEIAGVFRYERTKLHPLILKLKDFFKSSHDVTIIKQHNLREIKCKSANSEDFKKEILKINADIILVGTWSEKLKKEIIDLPIIATINIHPSLLPKYRGPNPYLQNILHQETYSGITFHLMNEEFDKGPILAQQKIKIYPNDTSKELKERTVFQARLLCTELLKKLETEIIIPMAQKEDDATYFSNISDYDKMLDFQKETAEEIHARIRALHPWLPTYVTYKNKFFIPNPYKLKILNEDQTYKILTKNNISNAEFGQIIDANYKSRSITIYCKNNKSIKLTGVRLYGIFNKVFTQFYIKQNFIYLTCPTNT